MALPPPAPPSGIGAVPPPPDPMAGASGDDTGSDTVVCTIAKTSDGSYMVYPGDEPDAGVDGDMSEDDDDAMGGAGGGPGGAPMGGAAGSSGQPADSIGQALKLAMDILQSDKSSEGAPGSADDQFAAGFGASKSPTPAGMGGA